MDQYQFSVEKEAAVQYISLEVKRAVAGVEAKMRIVL